MELGIRPINELNTAEEIDKALAILYKRKVVIETNRIEVYSRIVGYYRNVNKWNQGKRQEFNERKVFNLDKEKK